MKFCKFCGEQVNENAKFCKHCGEDLNQPQDEDAPDQSEERPQDQTEGSEQEAGVASSAHEDDATDTTDDRDEEQASEPVESETAATILETDGEKPETTPKKKGKMKYVIISVAVLFLLLIGTYTYGKYTSSASHLLDDFETTVQDKDTKALAKLLTTEEKDLTIDADSLEGFVDFFDSKPSELKSLITHLENQSGKNDIGSAVNYTVDLVKDGKQFVIFDDYQLVLNPVYITVAVNYKDTDIIVNGDVLATTDRENFNREVGPLIPGEYDIEAVYDTGLFHITDEQYVRTVDPGYAPLVSFRLDGDMVSFSLYSNGYDKLKNIEVFVNGKETGWNIAKEDKVGPLLTDGSMNVSFEAEFPWGTVVTNEMPLDDRYLEPDLGDSDAFKQEMMDEIITFNEDLMDIYTSGDIDVLTNTTDEFVINLFEEMMENAMFGIEYEGMFHGVDFYLESFDLKQDYDGFWRVTVDTITYFEEGFFERGDKPNMEKTEDEIRYELMYEPKADEWFVEGLDQTDMMEEDKMERYTEEDPELYQSDWESLLEDAMEELEDLDMTDELNELEEAMKELEDYLDEDFDEEDLDPDTDKGQEKDEDKDKKDKDKDKD